APGVPLSASPLRLRLVITLLRIELYFLDLLAIAVGIPGIDAALIKLSGFEFLLRSRFFICLQPLIEDSRRMAFLVLMAARCNVMPEPFGLDIVGDEGWIHRANDTFVLELGRLDAEQFPKPDDEGMQDLLVKHLVDFIA